MSRTAGPPSETLSHSHKSPDLRGRNGMSVGKPPQSHWSMWAEPAAQMPYYEERTGIVHSCKHSYICKSRDACKSAALDSKQISTTEGQKVQSVRNYIYIYIYIYIHTHTYIHTHIYIFFFFFFSYFLCLSSLLDHYLSVKKNTEIPIKYFLIPQSFFFL